jgi:putative DNA primase/helicase
MEKHDANSIHGSEGPVGLRNAFDAAGSMPSPHPATENLCPPEYSDDDLALKFAGRHSHHLRYVAEAGRWMKYDGQRWTEEKTLEVTDLVRQANRRAAKGAARVHGPGKLSGFCSTKTIGAVEKLARSDRRLVATIDQWDTNPFLLNTPAGVVDLKTGELRPHRPNDYMTKITAVAPHGECPVFQSFLHRVTAGDQEIQAYFARVFGYALTGSIKEHALFFCCGSGGNGKSVLLNAISNILGDYAQTTPIETFTASKQDRHPTELADLRGARLVTVSETEEGRHWAEAKLKALTGGDKIKARKMRQDFSEFTPCFKLIVAGNHKPALRSVDESMKRRLNLIPFDVTIPKADRDHDLPEKLKAEYPGILKWMLQGCLEWLRIGLQPPTAVTNATADYMENEDTLSAWIAERCEKSPQAFETSGSLFRSWSDFADATGEYVGSIKEFSQKLEKHGFVKKRTAIGTIFRGIDLKPCSTAGHP